MSKLRIPTSIITKARRSELSDAHEIVKFVNKSTTEMFGANTKEFGNIIELIEKSILSITLEDECNQRILSQACFFDYPNVQQWSGPNSSIDWPQWLNKYYEVDKHTSLNTLFMHFFASDSQFSIGSVQELIKSAFKAVPECHYILLCTPTSTVPEQSLSAVFAGELKSRKLSPSELSKRNFNVYITKREQHIPVLHIRQSNVNDNDDLTPLFNACTHLLKATYGDYYLAEMIEAQDEHNKCLTAEAQGFGMAFMSLTKDVNVQLLNECFELRPFHGLCKSTDKDVLEDQEIQQDEEKHIELSERRESVLKVETKLSEAGQIELGEAEEEIGAEEPHQNDKEEISSKKMKNPTFEPKYFGSSNAFAIQLFCIDELYESRSIDFLPKAFACFPDRDYCVLTLPSNVPEFALLQQFVRVTPRHTNRLQQELYIFHRGGLVQTMEVREATKDTDYATVAHIVHNLDARDLILDDLKKFIESRKETNNNGLDIRAYVAECLGRLVAVAILRPEEDIEYLRSMYQIEDFIYFTHHRRDEHAHLNHLCVVPVFSFLTRHFIKEILRKSSFTCLYYPIYPNYENDDYGYYYDSIRNHSLTTALHCLVPVCRRDQIVYEQVNKLPECNWPSERVLGPRYNYTTGACALNHLNRKLLLEPKIGINLRLVVVGASELTLAFLEHMLLRNPHLRFNNVTLVSAQGLPGRLRPEQSRAMAMGANHFNYSPQDHGFMSLRSWCNCIQGKMIGINRRKKEISIEQVEYDDDPAIFTLPYDHLILGCGEQYYPVAPINHKVYSFQAKRELTANSNRPLLTKTPSNLFTINSEYDAEKVLRFFQQNFESRGKIVIYGLDLNALCLIQCLITEMGIDGKRIYVFCEQNKLGHIINNKLVSKRIQQKLFDCVKSVEENCVMHEWNDGLHNASLHDQIVNSIVFRRLNKEGDEESIRVDQCDALICYHRKDVDYETFTAVNKAHLVYDGRLVVDNQFHTNDACIRAGGRMTKFKRMYYVDEWTHSCFNQKEVGADMANQLIKLIDPTIKEEEQQNDDNDVVRGKTDSDRVYDNQPDENVLIKIYKRPLVNYGQLPDNLFYLNVTRPGVPIPFEEQVNQGNELVTDTKDNGYFRIHLNDNKCVETITCLSHKKFNATNFAKLYGLHEKFLNKLLLKFAQNSIPDFFVYFNDSWCLPLYHDRFKELCKEIRDISINPGNGLKSVNDILNEYVDNDLILTKEQRNKIDEYFVQSSTKSLIEKRLLNYLNYNSNHLPMFAKPDMI